LTVRGKAMNEMPDVSINKPLFIKKQST